MSSLHVTRVSDDRSSQSRRASREASESTGIHATRLTDGKPLYLQASEIRYGAPTKNGTLAAALLRKISRPGDATYLLRTGASFGEEVHVEDRLNQKASQSRHASRGAAESTRRAGAR